MDRPNEQMSPPLLVKPSTSQPATPVKTYNRAAPEVEERWREVSGLRGKEEVLLGEFQCSYTGDLIVSNGSLFLSTNYLVFYSSLGALSVKKMVIPWLSVKSIELSVTNYDVSSGIKLQLRDGQQRQLTQFVSRDSVYELMTRIWTRAKQNAEASTDLESDGKLLVFEASNSNNNIITSGGSLSSSSLSTSNNNNIVSNSPGSSSALPSPLSAEMSAHLTASVSKSAPASLPLSIGPPPNLTGAQPVPTVTVTVCEHWVEPSTESAGCVVLPIGLDEFERLFVDDEGAFFNSFHADAGLGGPDNCWIKPYPKTENVCCCSRDFNFQQPITTSFPLAPATTRVKQTHRWFHPGHDLLYLSTSSMMPDIPYGSSFSIETKWKIKRVDAASCEVTCFVEGNYLKWLFGFRNTVEALIKKDGSTYVKGLLERMIKTAETKHLKQQQLPLVSQQSQQVFKEPSAKPALIKPATIRETPPRLTPPPKKPRSRFGKLSGQAVFVVGLVVVILLIVIFVYLRQLSFSIQANRPIGSVVVEHLKEEVRGLKEKLEAIERLLNEL